MLVNLKFPDSHNALISFKSYSEKVLVLRQYSMNLLKFSTLRLRINFKTAFEMLTWIGLCPPSSFFLPVLSDNQDKFHAFKPFYGHDFFICHTLLVILIKFGIAMKKRIIFRLPDSMYEQINALTKEGKFKNLSEVVRAALKEFLSKEGVCEWVYVYMNVVCLVLCSCSCCL